MKSKITGRREIAEAPILIDDVSPTILDIRSEGRRFRSDIRFFPPKSNSDKKGIGDRPLGLIVIDYLQLARGGASSTAAASRRSPKSPVDSRLWRKTWKSPLAISQLNRGLENVNKRPQLSDLRESG